MSQLSVDAPKRRRVPLPPCPDELFYKDGEIINSDRDRRVQGGSCSFNRDALDIIPLAPPFPSSWRELIPIIGHMQINTSLHKVLKELYRNDEFDANQPLESYDDEAFKHTYSNKHQSQYYLQTVTKPTTVTHIIRDGRFWDIMEENKRLHKGELAYTRGFLWCNTSPNWTWRSGTDGTTMRCRIELPENTQIVVDRSPVFGGSSCQFDEHRTSLFPDVLLPPGEFEIVSVKRYRSEDERKSDAEDVDYDVEVLKPEERRPDSVVLSDEEYAARMLKDVPNFVDVRLKSTRMMRLPDV